MNSKHFIPVFLFLVLIIIIVLLLCQVLIINKTESVIFFTSENKNKMNFYEYEKKLISFLKNTHLKIEEIMLNIQLKINNIKMALLLHALWEYSKKQCQSKLFKSISNTKNIKRSSLHYCDALPKGLGLNLKNLLNY